jgi:hypothetical protein
LNLSGFNAKAPPPKTRAFWDIVNASRAPEDAEMADAIDLLRNPAAVTLGMIQTRAGHSLGEFIRDRRNSRVIPQRLREAGYEPVRNPDAESGLWVVAGKRQAIYAKRDMAPREQIASAKQLVAMMRLPVAAQLMHRMQ